MANELFETLPIPKAVAKLALPTMLGQLSTIIYNLTDTYFISATGDADQIAAVSLSMPVSLIIMSLGAIFGYGGSSTISRLLGAKKEEQIGPVSSYCFWTGLILCIPILLFGLIFLSGVASLAGAEEGTLAPTMDYLRVILIGSPFILLSNMLIHMIRGEGSARQASAGLILGTGVNIVLDPVMILGMNLGVTGAAIATVFGNAASVAYYFFYFRKGNTAMSLSPKRLSFTLEIQKSVISVGIPGGMVTILMSVSNIVLNHYMALYGSSSIAAMGIASKINSFAVMLVVGLCQGVQPLIGYNYASRDYTRMRASIRFSILSGICLGAFFTLLFLALAPWLAAFFVSDPLLLEKSARFLRILTLSSPILAVSNLCMSVFQASGKGGRSLFLTVCRQLVVFLPVLVLLNLLLGEPGVAAAQPVADAVMALVSSVLCLMFLRPLKQQPQEV